MNPVLKRLRFRRFSTVQLLIVLAALLIAAPFVEEVEGGNLILSVLFSLVLIAAVFAVANRKRSLVIALVLAIPAITARWINQLRPDLVHPAVFLVFALVLLAFVIGHLLYSESRPGGAAALRRFPAGAGWCSAVRGPRDLPSPARRPDA